MHGCCLSDNLSHEARCIGAHKIKTDLQGIWSLYAWRAWQRHERVQAGGTYELAVTSDEGQHLLQPQ